MLEHGFFVMTGYNEQIDLFDYKVVQSGMHSWMSLESQLETVKSYRTPFYPPFCRKNTTLEILSSKTIVIICQSLENGLPVTT